MKDEEFEAISHSLRIKILEILSKKAMGFSELKRELGIESSGKLDFHLKKLKGLVTLENGKYVLTRDGYAALQAISTIRRYGWQKRAYILNIIIYFIINVLAAFKVYRIWLYAVFPASTIWIIFYSYWSIVRRGVFKRV
ncbi:MAG: hypothetical protein DRJ45_01060 [Thermoprotei archaeon]|nr:MAG: hypothetical protein DRJ45_01060 [Thermoprotei archaeon]